MPSRDEKLQAGLFPVDVPLVRRLIARQFPQWAGLPVRPVAMDGWDNWTFYLGDRLKVRLPSSQGYQTQTAKESRWLPLLAPLLPVAVPVPAGIGEPGEGFAWPWSVYYWIEGDPVTPDLDRLALACDLAAFLNALQAIDATGGPVPGEHSFYRGADPMQAYGADARRYVDALEGKIETAAAHAVLDSAARSMPSKPVWVHGDVAVGNLLTRHGKLSAVLDFGCAAVGDPSCDLAIAFTFFDSDSRAAFRRQLQIDDDTWARGRTWALWKAALLASANQIAHAEEHTPLDVIAAILADHRAAP